MQEILGESATGFTYCHIPLLPFWYNSNIRSVNIFFAKISPFLEVARTPTFE